MQRNSYFCGKNQDMNNSHYRIFNHNKGSAAGIDDFRKSCGGIIGTNGCMLLLVTSGYAVASINFRRYALKKGCMALFFYDEVFRMEKISESFSAKYACLSYALAEEGIMDVPSPHFWETIYNYPVYHASQDEWSLLNGWWEQMLWVGNETEANYRDAILKTHFHSLLLAMDSRVANMTLPTLYGDVNRQWKLVTDFFKLLIRHCHEKRDVMYYADRLCISTSYLNKLCRKVLHSSPKEMIDMETVSGIKSYLTNTDLSVKKIAQEMNFEDDSYLCKYFRRLTGMSPIAFRNCTETL